jgi:hypothetical protein
MFYPDPSIIEGLENCCLLPVNNESDIFDLFN